MSMMVNKYHYQTVVNNVGTTTRNAKYSIGSLTRILQFNSRKEILKCLWGPDQISGLVLIGH